eukprot:12847773-Alexandrium_andersonii.AAC.1
MARRNLATRKLALAEPAARMSTVNLNARAATVHHRSNKPAPGQKASCMAWNKAAPRHSEW